MPPLLANEWVVAESGQHPIMLLLRKPSRFWTILVAVTGLLALTRRPTLVLIFVVLALILLFFRVVAWYTERIVLTPKRIIHVQGVVETTRTEAWLRLDRISGMRIVESFPGYILRYANLSVEAPGDHPGLTRLYRICKATRLYAVVRNQVMESPGVPRSGNDDASNEYQTEPLPVIFDPGLLPPPRCHICWRRHYLP